MTCGVLVFDRKATSATGSVVIRACGAVAGQVVQIGRDSLFATCSRHNARLDRAGVRAARQEEHRG